MASVVYCQRNSSFPNSLASHLFQEMFWAACYCC